MKRALLFSQVLLISLCGRAVQAAENLPTLPEEDKRALAIGCARSMEDARNYRGGLALPNFLGSSTTKREPYDSSFSHWSTTVEAIYSEGAIVVAHIDRTFTETSGDNNGWAAATEESVRHYGTCIWVGLARGEFNDSPSFLTVHYESGHSSNYGWVKSCTANHDSFDTLITGHNGCTDGYVWKPLEKVDSSARESYSLYKVRDESPYVDGEFWELLDRWAHPGLR